MDEFGLLYENYLDEEEISKKLKQDRLHKDNNKKNNKSHNNTYAKTIKISEFVTGYLGTEHDCSELKHQGLKSFNNPYVVGVSNDFARKNPDCVNRDEILVVIDAFGNPGSYINPNLLKNIQTMEEYKYLLLLLNKIKIHSFENAKNLAYMHKTIMLKINELERRYIDSCDLLKVLSKEKILDEIRNYVKQIKETQSEWFNELLEVDNILDYEISVLDKEIKTTKQKRKSK